ncbi:NUDIX hydrolase [Ottowia sp.]|uniref:NUDIX hydrolase n=1 Tax=Ottowia sp. TaxID=1898956 RepID=UPI003A89C6B8
MELNHDVIDTPPRDAASMVMLRDGAPGLQVLLMRRHTNSAVLGGAYVFAGGKVDQADSQPASLDRLDRPPADLHPLLGEPALPPALSAAFFVAAAREAFEESGLLFALRDRQPLGESAQHAAFEAIAQGQPFSQMLADHALQLDTRNLAPWSRWITPRRPSVMNKRFDTRFFLAAVPPDQQARIDDFEVTEARWLTPRAALAQYRDHEIDMAPPQIVSLLHLLQYRDVAHALADARTRRPPLIQPEAVEDGGTRVLCYPGDTAHPESSRALPAPVPTRVVWRNQRFEPPQGLAAFID